MSSSSRDFISIAAQYAEDILTGDIPACKFVKQACQRFVDDYDRSLTNSFPYRLDFEKAQEWCEFLEKMPHVKGRWAANHEKLKLSSWQVFVIVNIYGWVHKKTGLRRFREVYIEVPRKNGKSFLVASIGNGMLTIDGEHGAEVYCGATTEKQAWEVYRPAKLMCTKLPAFRNKYGIVVNARSIVRESNGDKFEPLIGDPGDGSSPSCAIVDEFHEHPTSDQVDTMQTGMGARDQPLLFIITTAGSDTGGPCYEKRQDVINILRRTVEDERIFGIIYTLDEDDEWNTIEAQIKANPNYGVSVSADFLEGQLAQARRSAVKQNAYRTKHLNQWVGAKTAWLNVLALHACRKKNLNLADQRGRKCFIGLDLASKTDVACKAILFPPDDKTGKYRVFVKHYLPESALEDNANAERYRAWHAEGWLTITPGNVTDFSYIEEDMKESMGEFEIQEIAYDPFQATQFATHMLEDGYPMIEYGQTVKNISEPMKQLEAEILKQNIEFEMDPMLFWMFGNVVAKVDAKDNIFPRRERNQNKIDGPVSVIIAMARAIAMQEANPYDTRGIRVVEG